MFSLKNWIKINIKRKLSENSALDCLQTLIFRIDIDKKVDFYSILIKILVKFIFLSKDVKFYFFEQILRF